MDDLISRQAAIDTLAIDEELLKRILDNADNADIVDNEREKYEWGLGLTESHIADIKDLPSAQPERKNGRWIGEERQRLIDETDGGYVYVTDIWWYCSECGNPKGYVGHKPEDKYCNECGADMRGEQND